MGKENDEKKGNGKALRSCTLQKCNSPYFTCTSPMHMKLGSGLVLYVMHLIF